MGFSAVLGLAGLCVPATAWAEQTTPPTVNAVEQVKVVKGHVVDENGEPLIGVTVKAVGANAGAITDLNGNFSLQLPAGKKHVQLSYTGYKTLTVQAGGGQMNISMEPDVMGLEDVVVIGYGTMKKRDLTGSVSSVKSAELLKTPTYNVMEAVQGQVAGFDITRTTGELNGELKMTLRGNRSIYGNNEPLIIVDGMEGSFEELNPNDIESIEVLKDASSTAIYGSAGANGVILITTKNPQKDKFSINLDAYVGVNTVTSFPKMNTGDDYISTSAARLPRRRASGTRRPTTPASSPTTSGA